MKLPSKYSGVALNIPPSPCTPSNIIAVVLGVIASSIVFKSLYGTCLNPANKIGNNGRRSHTEWGPDCKRITWNHWIKSFLYLLLTSSRNSSQRATVKGIVSGYDLILVCLCLKKNVQEQNDASIFSYDSTTSKLVAKPSQHVSHTSL